MHAHRRQFLLGPRPMPVRDDWESISIDRSGELYLSYCPELPVEHARGSGGAGDRVLVGDAIDTSPRTLPPDRQMRTAATDDQLLIDSRDWAGRWLLVLDGQVHLDACGMLGCLYRRSDVDGRMWASSSPALLQIAELGPGDPYVAPDLHHQVGLDFYPAPMTRYGSTRRLLASQVLDVRPDAPATLSPRPLPEPALEPRDESDVLDEIAARLVQGMRSADARWSELWLPLTGGHDSRVLLAAARHAGVEGITTYTHELPWPAFSRADRTVPPRIAAAAGFAHQLIPPQPLEPRRLELVDRHTARSVTGPDRTFLAARQWDAIPSGAGVLRGSCFEIANCAYYRRATPPDWVGAEPPSNVARRCLGLDSEQCGHQVVETFSLAAAYPGSRPHDQGIHEWCTWELLTPSRMDWRDRFYLEQRMGSWACAVEQQLDVTGTGRIAPFSCHALIAAALSLPEERRQWRWWQVDVISRLAPDLARIPVNCPDGITQRIARRAGDELHLLRSARYRPRHVRDRVNRVLARRRLVRQG